MRSVILTSGLGKYLDFFLLNSFISLLCRTWSVLTKEILLNAITVLRVYISENTDS